MLGPQGLTLSSEKKKEGRKKGRKRGWEGRGREGRGREGRKRNKKVNILLENLLFKRCTVVLLMSGRVMLLAQNCLSS